MVAQHNRSLVSIIVPVYNVEEFIPKCLDSILGQTYSNIEVIVVNDGSRGNIEEIVAEYQRKNTNITLIGLDKNQGLFRARLEGFKAAKGDYIVSIDGDDSISVDYVRTMVTRAEKDDSDIVLPEKVIENNKEKFIFNLANDLPFNYLMNNECLEKFFEQQGDNYIWHQVAGVLYSRRVFGLAAPFLDSIKDHIVMCEDVLFSVVFWSHVRRIDRAPTAHYYYYQHENSSIANSSSESLRTKIESINTVFDKVTEYLRSQRIYAKVEKNLLEWENLYSLDYRNQINNLTVSEGLRGELGNLIRFGNANWSKRSQSQFYKVTTRLNDGLEELKQKIIDPDTECISFDIFDTLITRPFMQPSDLFYILEGDFKKLDRTFRLESFHDMRVKSEELTRLNKRHKEDITLKQVYRVMQNEYFVDKTVALKMLEKELEHEMGYCKQRETARELYDLAIYLGKKVIITSDMYLPRKTIKAVLSSCGYEGYDELYVSSHHGLVKATQNLYRQITNDLSVLPSKILHIGDNYDSDVVAAKGAGWKAAHFPRALDVAPGVFGRIFGDSAYYAQSHLGIASAYALAMNKCFDNPFRSFLHESNYNASPYLTGYFALGLSLLGFTKWMIEDTKDKGVESIIFLSRDGYLPMRIFKIFQKALNLTVRSYYLPTSRKAIIPLSIFGEANLAEMRAFNYRGQITDSILASLKSIQKEGSDNTLEDVDYDKARRLQRAFVKTYGGYFEKHTAVMDIGYSGRPEQIFTKLFNTPIETYFMYTGNDEAKRRLGRTVNVYGRLQVAGFREKIISEIGPSCIGYDVVGDVVEPIFEKEPNIPYYERYMLSEMQRGAEDFVSDYLKLFCRHLSSLTLGDNQLTMRPLDQATVTPTQIDREIFRGLVHEDDIAGDAAVDLFNTYYSTLDNKDRLHEENSHLTAELQSHMSIKRSAKLLAGNIKRRIIYGKKR